jgi:NADPH:quinone reductase-like Zn-dependent oxidoreductase
MKAVVVDKAGPPNTLHIKDVPVPTPAASHVIIALEYAGVGIWDAKQRAGAWGAVKAGTILGADGSGTIAAIGSHVKDLSVGDRVYSYSYGNSTGGFHAEYVSVPADRVARVPAHVDMVVAGGMPCVALTAQSGIKALKVTSGQTLLVFGASGGVGSLAVWLASSQGVNVVGTARPDAQEYVRSLGAAHTIDPTSREREAVIKRAAKEGFDACLTTSNGDTLHDFLSHLKAKAPVGYPHGVEPEPHFNGHRGIAFDGAMSHDAFMKLNAAIGSREIPLKTEVFSFKEVVEAHRRIEQGHIVGKIVLQIGS